jgi:predicted DNA-binding protein
MTKSLSENVDTRDASLRVSKRTRDQLKMAAAVLGRPLYDVTNEAMEKYLAGVKLSGPSASMLRGRTRKGS